MKKVLDYILFGLILTGLVFIAWKTYTLKEKVEYITLTDTVKICDTITNWQYDTVYFSHYDTLKLPVVDTINDTILKIDSVLVQIPISTTVYDTTITNTNYRTSLRAVLSGFQTSVDSLYLSTEIMQQRVKKQPWYTNLCPAVGIGYGTGGAGVFIGVGYAL